MSVTVDFVADHVVPEMRQYLEIEGRIRVDECWEDIWVKTPGADEIFIALNDCLNAKGSTKPSGVTIAGDPDTGKSRAMEYFVKIHKGKSDPNSEYAEIPAIYLISPDKPNPMTLLECILAQLGVPTFYNQSEAALRRYTIRMMQACKVRVVMIDELFDINRSSAIKPHIISFMGFLKSLINETGRPFVASGVPTLIDMMLTDEQIATRFDTAIRLKPMTIREFVPVLLAYEMQLPLRQPSNFSDNPAICEHLYRASAGYIGRLSKILRAACRPAIESGEERITLDLLESIKDRSIRAVIPQED